MFKYLVQKTNDITRKIIKNVKDIRCTTIQIRTTQIPKSQVYTTKTQQLTFGQFKFRQFKLGKFKFRQVQVPNLTNSSFDSSNL